MKTAAIGIATLLLLCGTGATLAQTPDIAEAAGRCETEVTETLERLHGPAARSVRFDAGKRQLSRGDGDDAAIRGAGRYTLGGTLAPFEYSCAYNLRSGETAGVVVRDTGSARAAPAWEPDLAKVSPGDCESAAAALLKDRNPRISRIAFDSETRRLEPASNERIGLQGRGALQRAPGMLSLPFSYRCEFDGRNGRVVAVQASD
jgi:hypothetical protein